MNRIKYIIKKLKSLKFKNMINISKKISQKTNKFYIFILFDIINCAFKYGAGYMDYFEFEFYLLNKDERKTYITGSINNNIIKTYNNPEYFDKFSNKVSFNNTFKKYLGRNYFLLNEKNYIDFVSFLISKDKIIVKPLDSSGGDGIEIIRINAKTDRKKLYNKLLSNKQVLVEEVIKQHREMNRLYEKSVNTLRILSFLKDDGEIVILKTILKIGNGGVVDNFCSGGMYTFVNETGEVYVPGIDEAGKIYKTHPTSNAEIIGFKVPEFKKVIKLIKEVGKIIPEVRYVGWDVAISENGPVLIEGNEFSGIFQVKPSLTKVKQGDLPNYKKYMDI